MLGFEASKLRTKSQYAIQDFSLNAPGLVDVVIRMPGTGFMVDMATTGVVTVEVDVESGGGAYRQPLTATAGFVFKGDFASLKLNAPQQPGKFFRLVILENIDVKGGAPVGSTYVPSVPSLVETPERYRTRSNIAFIGTATRGLVAGQFPVICLFNQSPGGSPINRDVYLTQLTLWSSLAGVAQFWRNIATSGGAASATPYQPKNMLAPATGELVIQAQTQTSAVMGALSDVQIGALPLAAGNVPQVFRFAEPVLIRSGSGFTIYGGTLASDLTIMYECYTDIQQ